MEFLKKNYEKIILSVVLLGLAAAAALLPSWVSEERRRLDEIANQGEQTIKAKEFQPVNLTTNEAALRRVKRPEPLALSGDHNLFNPVLWKRLANGNLIKVVSGNEIGVGALTVTDIRPLNTVVSYEGSSGTNEFTQYKFKVVRELKGSTVTRSLMGAGSKNDIFVLKEMRPKQDPNEFILELIEDKQVVTVTRVNPFIGIAGFKADLRYEPEKLLFSNKKVGDSLLFGGDTNKIVAITASNVTVQATSNTKRTTVDLTKAPTGGAR